LIGSVIIWTLSSFPRNTEYSADYTVKIDAARQAFEVRTILVQKDELQLLTQKYEKEARDLKRKMRTETTEKSYIGHIGKFMAPFFAPIGIDWRGSVALLTGFVAKEIVVSTMGVLYAVEDDEPDALKHALRESGMTPLSALGMMFFVLLYVPCLATIATIRKETQSWGWAFFSVAYSTILAWGVAFTIYQGGMLLGFGSA
jgi:ferrous iron transport protein B